MSRRTRIAGATGVTATTPAVVSNATPVDQAPPPGGVVPAETPTSPAVPSTEPLASDQATAAPRLVDGTGTVATTIEDAERLAGNRPSVVPETPPRADLEAPALRQDEKRGGVVMEHVPGTTPLPADQITPVAPALVEPPASLAAQLALLGEEDRAALREFLGVPTTSGYAIADREPGDDLFDGKRVFPVDYDVEHNGKAYTPGGEPVALTFAEYQHFVRATAVSLDWLRAELAPVLPEDEKA